MARLTDLTVRAALDTAGVTRGVEEAARELARLRQMVGQPMADVRVPEIDADAQRIAQEAGRTFAVGMAQGISDAQAEVSQAVEQALSAGTTAGAEHVSEAAREIEQAARSMAEAAQALEAGAADVVAPESIRTTVEAVDDLTRANRDATDSIRRRAEAEADAAAAIAELRQATASLQDAQATRAIEEIKAATDEVTRSTESRIAAERAAAEAFGDTAAAARELGEVVQGDLLASLDQIAGLPLFERATQSTREYQRATEDLASAVQARAQAEQQAASVSSSWLQDIDASMQAARQLEEAERQRVAIREWGLRREQEIAAQREAERVRQQAVSVARAQQAVEEEVAAAERTYRDAQGRIREAQLRQLLSPREARQAGLEAGREYNAAVLEAIDRGRAAGAFTGVRGQELMAQTGGALRDLGGSLAMLDSRMHGASHGAQRLNLSLASLLRQATGTHPAVAQLASVLGTLAIGSTMMVGILAGLAAIAVAWNRLSREARESKRETEDAIARLRELARIQALPEGGQVQADVQRATTELQRLEDQLRRVERQIRQTMATRPSGFGASGIDAAFRTQAESLRRQIEEQQRIISAGQTRMVEDTEQGVRRRIAAEASALAALIAANNATEAEYRRARQIVAEGQARLAELSEAPVTPESVEERARVLQIVEQITRAMQGNNRETARRAQALVNLFGLMRDRGEDVSGMLRDIARLEGQVEERIRRSVNLRAEDAVQLRQIARTLREVLDMMRSMPGMLGLDVAEFGIAPEAIQGAAQELRQLQDLFRRASADLLAMAPEAAAAAGRWVDGLRIEIELRQAELERQVERIVELFDRPVEARLHVSTPRFDVRDLQGRVQVADAQVQARLDLEAFGQDLQDMRRAFEETRLRMAEDFARGLIDRDSFERQGREAAQAFNAGLIALLDDLSGLQLPRHLEPLRLEIAMQIRALLQVEADEQARQASIRAFADQVEATNEVVSALGDLADAAQFTSVALAAALRGVETALAGIGRLNAAQGLTGFAQTAAQVSGALSIAAGVVSIFTAIIGAASERERQRQIAQDRVNQSLARLQHRLDGFAAGSANALNNAIAAIDGFVRSLQADPAQAARMLRFPGQVTQAFELELARLGMTLAQFRAIAESAGIADVFDERGRLVIGTLGDLQQALRLAREAVTRFSESFDDQRKLMEAERTIRGVELTPEIRIQGELDLLQRFAPELIRAFGLDQFRDLDLGAAEVQAELRAAIIEVFEAIRAGTIPAELLDLLPEGVRTLLDSIVNIGSALNDLADETERANQAIATELRRIPQGFRIFNAELRRFEATQPPAQQVQQTSPIPVRTLLTEPVRIQLDPRQLISATDVEGLQRYVQQLQVPVRETGLQVDRLSDDLARLARSAVAAASELESVRVGGQAPATITVQQAPAGEVHQHTHETVIHIHPPPGMDARDVAREVRAILREEELRQRAPV